MNFNKIKLFLFLGLFFSLLFLVYGFKASEKYQIFVNTKTNKFNVENNDVINFNGEPFEFEFVIPKTKDITTTLYCSEKSDNYYKILQGLKQLSKLEPYQTGRFMAVSISSFTKLDSTLRVYNEGCQPYAFDGFDFNSFNSVDSNLNTYKLKLNINSIDFFKDNDFLKYNIHDFPNDTIFCVFTLNHNFDKKKNKNQVKCFKLVKNSI